MRQIYAKAVNVYSVQLPACLFDSHEVERLLFDKKQIKLPYWKWLDVRLLNKRNFGHSSGVAVLGVGLRLLTAFHEWCLDFADQEKKVSMLLVTTCTFSILDYFQTNVLL